MLNVLIIGSVWPEPTSSGAGLRMMQYMQLFRMQNWRVTFASTAAASEHMADLDAYSVQCVTVAVNDAAFDVFLADLKPDMVVFDRFSMEEQFGWRVEQICPQALRILETIDLHCLRHARHIQFKRQPAVVRDVTNLDLYNDVAVREIAAIYRSDLSILTSDDEMELLEKRFALPSEIIHVCPFMFDTQQLHDCLADFEQRQHL